MKVLALTTALLVGISSAAMAAGAGDTGAGSATPSASEAPVPSTITPNQQEAVRAGVNNAIAVNPAVAPLGTNNAGAPITSTNPAVGNTPTATNTPGVNNVPGGLNPNGTVAGAPVQTGPVTNGQNPQGAANPSVGATAPLPHTPGNGTSGRN